jgi:hypothetical protein
VVTETERRISNKIVWCLVITSPGWRTLYVSPESDVAEWVRALSSLEAPPNAGELRRNTIGERPVASVPLEPDADDDAPTSVSLPSSGPSASAGDEQASSATSPPSASKHDDAPPTPLQYAPSRASSAFKVDASWVSALSSHEASPNADELQPDTNVDRPVASSSTFNVDASWPPAEGQSQWSLKETVQAAATNAAAHAAADPDAPAVQRAVAASKKATASVVFAASDTAESRRDVAEAVLTLQGIEWPARVTKALSRIDQQAAEFDAQLQHMREKGALPNDVLVMAVEQLLDAIGAIVVVLQGLLAQAEHEVRRDGYLFTMEYKLCPELRRLHAALAAVRRWGLEVPPELSLADGDALCSMPLAATDTSAGGDVRATVQRVIGALVVAGGEEALKHVAWVDFDHEGEPVFPQTKRGFNPTMARPPPAAPKSICACIDAALEAYGERATAATGELVPKVLGDVAAYARAKGAALAEPGAKAAIAELAQLTTQVPQPCGPRNDDQNACDKGGNAHPLPPSGLPRAKALARIADPFAPPPTALAHAVHKQHRAVAGSKRLYEIISRTAPRAGVELVVLPGGVKKLPRTVFKCGVNYNCDLSQITDQVRCTVVCESLAQVAAMLRALLASGDVSVVRVKNRFAPDYDATPAGGYLDLQTIVAFELGGAGEWMLGEVQVNLWSMLRIKEAPGGGHTVFNFARSLRAYDEATYRHKGKLDADVAGRIAAGALLVVLLQQGGCETTEQQIELARALKSSKCRVATLDVRANKISDAGAMTLAEALKANTSVSNIDLGCHEIGDAGAVALAVTLKTNTTVTKISLYSNKIGDSAALALIDALKTNTSVTTINLKRNAIYEYGTKRAIADFNGPTDRVEILERPVSMSTFSRKT